MTPKAARGVLIEDHTMVRQLFAHLLRDDLGLRLVAEGVSVAEGRAAILREKPDLAVIDWMLPDGCGFDIIRTVAPQVPGTRWLVITSAEQGHVVREAVALGVQGFVMKRSNLATFREAVRRVLAGERYYCSCSTHLLVERLVSEGRAAATLTPRETTVLRGYARGENIERLAADLGVGTRTVQNHLTVLKDKLGLRESADLVRYAIKHGYIEAP